MSASISFFLPSLFAQNKKIMRLHCRFANNSVQNKFQRFFCWTSPFVDTTSCPIKSQLSTKGYFVFRLLTVNIHLSLENKNELYDRKKVYNINWRTTKKSHNDFAKNLSCERAKGALQKMCINYVWKKRVHIMASVVSFTNFWYGQ